MQEVLNFPQRLLGYKNSHITSLTLPSFKIKRMGVLSRLCPMQFVFKVSCFMPMCFKSHQQRKKPNAKPYIRQAILVPKIEVKVLKNP